MSYDLMVFNPENAPKAKTEFMNWYEIQTEWEETHDYDDPKVSSEELRNWFMEMIKDFASLNGPYAPQDIDDRIDEDELTDYSVGKDVIYAGFRFTVAEKAYSKMIELAEKHNVGFFDASGTGDIFFPNENGELEKIANETKPKTENKTKDIKLHSAKAISGSTFLGGPLAAGYLIYENLKALNKPEEGRKYLIIGIITTIVLFVGIFMLPEKIIEEIPNQLIPLIYTGIIWGFVEWKQGDILNSHKENGNSFFSAWRAAAVGFISLLILGVGIFGYVYMQSNNPAYQMYDNKIAEFTQNEMESLTFYTDINTKTNFALLKELDNNVIPKWESNINIVKDLSNIEGLSQEMIDQNITLLKYSELRLDFFWLTKKAISEDTDKYDKQLNILYSKIEIELEKLN